LTESEVSRRASTEASLALLDAIGPIYRGQSFFFDGASAGYRGQIGRNGAIRTRSPTTSCSRRATCS